MDYVMIVLVLSVAVLVIVIGDIGLGVMRQMLSCLNN